MNQLDFSPISEKDEQSLDTFSFLHNPTHHHRMKSQHQAIEGCTKMFEKLCRVGHNRSSYCFQLLKQFILFSSDEETIEIHYKYTQYELEQGTEYLNNVYGLRLKLTLGKAFEDIRNFSRKKKVYENPVYVQKLVSVYDKILKLNKQQSYRCVIKILASFIEKQVVSKNGLLKQSQSKPTVDLIETLEKQIGKGQVSWEQPVQPTVGQLKYRSDIKRQDLLKTAKLRAKHQERDRQTSDWKEEVENIDSYEEEAEDENPRIIIKSMSNRAYDYPYSLEYLGNSTKNPADRNKKQGKCNSISITPAKNASEEDVFQTKRKKSSVSTSRNSEDMKVIQNVIIIRGHKTHEREPDRYIRVPVVSKRVKIVEMVPESNRDNVNVGKGIENMRCEGGEKRGKKSAKVVNQIRRANQAQKSIGRANLQWNEKATSESHECLGCQYCQVIQEMEAYRMQRSTKSKPLHSIF